ncbi:MAG: MASE1 domain-containing protein [Zoogloea sp.]|nr:MASE1 domain-containing protein [Zoogloea sp.]
MFHSHRISPLAGIALAYAVCGLIALHIAIPPGYIAPLFPAAGIALAGMLIYGPRIWPAILLGSLVTNAEAVMESGFGSWGWIAPLCVGTGAVLQAFAGAALARRWIGFPNTLDTAGAIVRLLFIAAPLSCLVSASVGGGPGHARPPSAQRGRLQLVELVGGRRHRHPHRHTIDVRPHRHPASRLGTTPDGHRLAPDGCADSPDRPRNTGRQMGTPAPPVPLRAGCQPPGQPGRNAFLQLPGRPPGHRKSHGRGPQAGSGTLRTLCRHLAVAHRRLTGHRLDSPHAP